MTDHNPASIYGILESTESPCEEINESGTYTLTNDSGCIKITSSDVVFDCDGYNITDGALGVLCGIEIEGPVENITVRNCNISGFDYGMCASDVNGMVYEDVNSDGNTQSGATLDNCHGVLFNNSHFDNNGQNGADIVDSSDLCAASSLRRHE